MPLGESEMQTATTLVRFALRCAPALPLLLNSFWPAAAQAQTCDSAQGCATVMISGMASGLGKNVEGEAWGWVFGGGQAAGTSAIVGELGTIENTLTAISGQLSQIEQELADLECGIDTAFINQYASGIQSYFQTYQLWVADMKNGGTPSVEEMSDWANCAVGFPAAGKTCAISGGLSVLTMMQALANAASATAGSKGSIAACVAASAGELPTLNTLDDRPWYAANVEPITDWYLGLNAQGLAVLVEAWHFRAWQAAGSPAADSADDIYDAICPAGAKTEGCVDPINYYNLFFVGNVKSQLRAGGAPYSTDEYLILNGNNPFLLARSIEAYEKALDPDNSAGCAHTAPGSRDSAPPCGKTVGYYNDPFPSVEFGPYGYGSVDASGNAYGSWVASPFRAFQGLFNLGFNTFPFSGVTASRFLCTLSSSGGNATDCLQASSGGRLPGAGLQVGSKIVQFSDLEQSSDFVKNWLYGNSLIRFMDGGLHNTTSTQPFAINGYREIFLTYVSEPNCALPGQSQGGFLYYRSDGTDSSSDPDYYKFEICGVGGANGKGDDWKIKPLFDVRNQTRQYRWPVLDWSTLTCSDGSSAADALNPAGMPTLCGADFDAWFESIVPPGPSVTSLSAAADVTLNSSAPQSNDGAGWYLALNANPPRGRHQWAVVGFDRDALQTAIAAGEVRDVFLMLTPIALLPAGAELSPAVRKTGTDGIRIAAHPLQGDFVEGDGDLAGGKLASGTGATWHCAEEADPTDKRKECLQRWPNPLLDRKADVVAQQAWNQESALTWDVTNQVAEGVTQWILRLENGIPFADIDGMSLPLYFSREAAEEFGNQNLAPSLLVIFED